MSISNSKIEAVISPFFFNNSGISNQGNQSLPDAKLVDYRPSTQPQIAQRVGNQLNTVGINCSDHHQVLLVRCAELALFSIKRFFC